MVIGLKIDFIESMILEKLKAGTQIQHDQIEAGLNLLHPDFTFENYQEYLAKSYGFYKPWEDSVTKFFKENAQQNPEIAAFFSPKLPAIIQDLLNCGYSLQTINSLTEYQAKNFRNLAEILGAMYVIEGACLGGQVITKYLKKSLSLADNQCNFTAAYGKQTMPRWQEFKAIAENIATANMEDAIILSAQNTFTQMHSWYCTKQVMAA